MFLLKTILLFCSISRIYAGDFYLSIFENCCVLIKKSTNFTLGCGEVHFPQPRVVGGHNSSFGSHPWQAMLFVRKTMTGGTTR